MSASETNPHKEHTLILQEELELIATGKDQTSEPPIINCHTHTFTQKHVPPFLGRTVLPFPFYLLIYLPLFVSLYGLYHSIKNSLKFSKPWFRKLQEWSYTLRIPFSRYYLLGIVKWLFLAYVLFTLIPIVWPVDSIPVEWIREKYDLLYDKGWMLKFETLSSKILAFGLAFIFLPSIRHYILFLIKQIGKVASLIPTAKSKDLMQRYLSMARYNTYETQGKILERLVSQFPNGTRFVILPMDMKEMAAGPITEDFETQMQTLFDLKKSPTYKDKILPFVFVDPRRKKVGNQVFFDYEIKNGVFSIKPCYLKSCFEEHQIAGIKLYPSLGYYPFDPELIPIWIYAQEKGIPIITHCTKGSIYYRGFKKRKWDYHKVFKRNDEDPLLLGQLKNSDFCNNFIHPLNYLCLIEERLLRRVIAQTGKVIQDYFGYIDDDTELKRNLNELKICLAHYGGTDEWKKYLNEDRDIYNKDIITHPEFGINFLKNSKGKFSEYKLAQLWWETDWYSLITSMMLQYPNLYADISYILHNEEIFPLLERTLDPDIPKLRSRVLFGTDFFVVRNQKSDKHLYTNLISHLDKEDFDQIARINPSTFLTVNIH